LGEEGMDSSAGEERGKKDLLESCRMVSGVGAGDKTWGGTCRAGEGSADGGAGKMS
jgi:hypothetical protein